MPISFRCPSCGKTFKVGEDLAGKRAKCNCGQVFKIPAPAQPAPAQPAATPPAPVPPTQPAQGPADSSFGNWLDEELKEPAPETPSEYAVQTPEPVTARPTAPPSPPRTYVPEPRTTSSGSDEEGGGLMGIIIFILIFGVGNIILYNTTGWIILPIPRR